MGLKDFGEIAASSKPRRETIPSHMPLVLKHGRGQRPRLGAYRMSLTHALYITGDI